MSYEPEDVRYIKDIATMRILAQPLRLRIMDELLAEPMTVKGIAERLKLPVTRLYYHFNILEKLDVIRVVSTRMVSGSTEKSYQATAKLFLFDQEALAVGGKTSLGMVDVLIQLVSDPVSQEIRESAKSGLIIGAPTPNLFQLKMMRGYNKLTAEQALTFYERLEALNNDFANAQSPSEAGEQQSYGLSLVMYPRVPEESSRLLADLASDDEEQMFSTQDVQDDEHKGSEP